jgi:copper ion binding protein
MKTRKLSMILVLLLFVLGSSVNASNTTVKFRAETMTCGGCSGKIKKAVTAIEGVSNFEANLEARVVTIAYDDAKVKPEQLKEAITAIKYEVADYDPNEVITRKASFKADQMGCGGCAAKVKKNIGAEAGVLSVDVDLPTKEVKVEYDANKVSAKEIKNDFQKFSYTVTRYNANEKIKYARFKLDEVTNAADVEQKLAAEKGVYDVSVNEKTKEIAIAYISGTITEEGLAESIKKQDLKLVAAK